MVIRRDNVAICGVEGVKSKDTREEIVNVMIVSPCQSGFSSVRVMVLVCARSRL